jgi:hypothetical protein
MILHISFVFIKITCLCSVSSLNCVVWHRIVVALVAGSAISVDIISYIINVPKLVVFIEIPVSGVCVTIAV